MNILIVDDEYYIVQGIRNSIDVEKTGTEHIFCAYNVAQAQKYFLSKPVHILLTDIEMPGEDGFQLIQWVQTNYPKTIILILTGHQRFEYAYRAIQHSCFSYILKPVEKKTLNREILRAMSVNPDLSGGITVRETADDDSFVETVRNYIQAHIADAGLSRDDLADYIHMNPNYLSVVFKEKFGTTLTDYILRTRIDYAKDLLQNTAYSIEEVAGMSGFANLSYFYRKFKLIAGVTPKGFRK